MRHRNEHFVLRLDLLRGCFHREPPLLLDPARPAPGRQPSDSPDSSGNPDRDEHLKRTGNPPSPARLPGDLVQQFTSLGRKRREGSRIASAFVAGEHLSGIV